MRFAIGSLHFPVVPPSILWYNTDMTEKELYDRTNARSLSGAYLLEGDEELLKQQAIDRIVALLDSGFLDLNLKRLKAPDADLLCDAVRSLPVFDSLCVTIVTDFADDAVLDALEKKRLTDVLFDTKDTVLLFVRRGAARESAFTKLFKSRDRYVLFDTLDTDRAMRLCMRVCAQNGVRMDRVEAMQLTNMVGTDAYRLKNELSKLCDYVGRGGTVTGAVLKTVVTPSVEYEIFPMLNALLAGNKKTAMRMLTDAMKSGQENPLRVATFLEGRLRSMLIARELLDAKRPQSEILKTIGGNPKAAEMTIKNAQKFPTARLKSAVAAFAEINARMKQGLLDEDNGLLLAIYKSF